MTTLETNKKRASIKKKLAILKDKMFTIDAIYTKNIWSDKTYDKDRKDVLRNAELTLRLSVDTEYQSLQTHVWDLEEQLEEIGWGDSLLFR